MTRRGVKGYAVKTKVENAKRRLARLAKKAREKKQQQEQSTGGDARN
jgi:hypothetical protein